MQADLHDRLTARERPVLRLAAHGHSNAKIAAHLFISRRTAETQRAYAVKKLGLRSQVELARYAVRQGIIPADE